MLILAIAWLSKKITNPWILALLGLILIGVAIYGVTQKGMPTFIGIVVIAVGVTIMIPLIPHMAKPTADAPA